MLHLLYRASARTSLQVFILTAPVVASRQMSSKVDSSLNSAGLKPEESKALDERPVQSHEEPVISAIKEVG
jgi:hypothetical protein